MPRLLSRNSPKISLELFSRNSLNKLSLRILTRNFPIYLPQEFIPGILYGVSSTNFAAVPPGIPSRNFSNNSLREFFREILPRKYFILEFLKEFPKIFSNLSLGIRLEIYPVNQQETSHGSFHRIPSIIPQISWHPVALEIPQNLTPKISQKFLQRSPRHSPKYFPKNARNCP